jgi:hypothetical protein
MKTNVALEAEPEHRVITNKTYDTFELNVPAEIYVAMKAEVRKFAITNYDGTDDPSIWWNRYLADLFKDAIAGNNAINNLGELK